MRRHRDHPRTSLPKTGAHVTALTPRAPRLALLAGLLLASLFAPPLATAQEERIVQDIAIVGLKRLSENTVRSAIRTPTGLPFSQRVADEDIKRLFALGKFDDIDVETETVPGGIRVIYKFVESPVIEQIIFKGNRKVKDKWLRSEMSLKVGQVLQYHLLKLDEDHLAEKYREKRYANVEVRAEVSKGGTVVTFHIQENPRVYIRRVEFRNNHSVKARTLLKQMKTRKRWRWLPIFRAGRYEREKVKNDVFAVQEYYRDQGWLDAVAAHEIRYNDERERITLVVYVEEGDRYTVDRITIQGNTIFSEDELRSLMRLREQKPLLADGLRDDLTAFKALYGEQGYVEAKVENDVVHRREVATADVRFRIDEGIRYHIEKIKIGGMQRIQDHIIRRELTMYPGERFNSTLVDDSIRRLKNTGFFDFESPDSVTVDYEPGTRADTKNVLITVKEGKVGDINFGVGASSNTGLFGNITLTHRNFDIFDLPKDARDFFTGNAFVGGGQVLSLILRPGRHRQDYLLSFSNPSVYDSPYSFGTSVYYRERGWRDWDERRIGGTLSGGKRLTRDLVAGMTAKYENIDISHLDVDAPQDAKDVEGDHDRLSLEISMDYDKRDSRFLPSKGHMLGASIEGTTWDVKVAKLNLNASKYFTVWNPRAWGKHILSVRTGFGAAETYGDDVPIFERFFVGGSGSLRGFDFRGVGPVDPRTKDQIGGRYMLLGGVEYSIPVARNTVRAHTFLDAGTTERRIGDLTDLRLAWGVGLALRFGMFQFVPIQFDFGFPIVKKHNDDTELFTFVIGSAFGF